MKGRRRCADAMRQRRARGMKAPRRGLSRRGETTLRDIVASPSCDTSFTCLVSRPNEVSLRVAQNWLKRFHFGNFDVKDYPRFGRPVTDKVDAILKKVEQDRHISLFADVRRCWETKLSSANASRSADYGARRPPALPRREAAAPAVNSADSHLANAVVRADRRRGIDVTGLAANYLRVHLQADYKCDFPGEATGVIVRRGESCDLRNPRLGSAAFERA
ncbi:hypothetical protein EVAR_54310_1 [Eumeta japonica]|uniref:Mos1 transposase HTH domain-containing protein n=1 Tax=Eumeta variegata TaxID=151549 RepID=A0A4C1Z177_EUMVA|nr:hypothetical protein EVAR_54310_1 [Eumeta japonica]